MYEKFLTHKKTVCQKKSKKGFFKRENIGVSFLIATRMATKFAGIAMILSMYILQI